MIRRRTPPNSSVSPRASKASSSPFSTSNILILMVTHSIAFLSGTITASNRVFQKSLMELQCPHYQQEQQQEHNQQAQLQLVRTLHQFTNNRTKTTTTCAPCPKCDPPPACPPTPKCPTCPPKDEAKQKLTPKQKKELDENKLFPRSVRSFAVGMVNTGRTDFAETFDLGIPFDITDGPKDRDILMMYSKESAMPTQLQDALPQQKIDYIASAKEATENCDIMHVLYHYRGANKNLCLAIVPQYESYHIQNWMRMPPDGNKGGGDPKYPLRLVGRGMQWDGTDNFDPPKYEKQQKYTWPKLKVYLETLEDILKELKPIVNRIKYRNTVIVMVCNHGQSELLLNFACSAKTKGLDTQNVLVFATDLETKEIAESAGFTAYYEEKNFGYMTSEAAGEYGDHKFVQMMFAKVMCVHLVSMTGVDFLFQDVDIVWFKDPLGPFLDKSSPMYGYDAYFQDDGARSLRYTPWSANSGFYFVRNNVRTKYFLSQIVMAGDLILKTFSQQQALVAIMSEHASLYGLKVKVLNRAEDDFPGGFHYHRNGKDSYFRQFFEGKKDPYMFHMSWTFNKANKLLFMKQLGFWYVHEQCVEKKLDEISHGGQRLTQVCCSAEPLFSCHYRDKPSREPCSDSPPIDKDGRDFWK